MSFWNKWTRVPALILDPLPNIRYQYDFKGHTHVGDQFRKGSGHHPVVPALYQPGTTVMVTVNKANPQEAFIEYAPAERGIYVVLGLCLAAYLAAWALRPGIAGGLTSAFLFWAAWSYRQRLTAQASWSGVHGQVDGTEVVAVKSHDEDFHLCNVTVRYSDAGRNYIQIFQHGPGTSEAEAQRTAESLKQGDSIPVFVDPADPTRAALARHEPRGNWMFYVLIASGALTLLLALLTNIGRGV